MKWLKTKPLLLLLMILSLCFAAAGSAFAFGDIQNDEEKNAIEQLHKQGIIQGIGNGKFVPKGMMSVGTAVSLIVRGMDLNIDHIKFIKEPKASDYFTKVDDRAWYAQAFIIAHHNGLDIPRDINPETQVTREQFAHWLYNAIESKGDYAWIEIYMMIEDEDQVDPAYMTSIQRLLIGKIAKTDKDGKFRPKQPITRSEAAGMLHRALEFVKNTPPIEPLNPYEGILSDVTLKTESVNAYITKVTVSAQAPHPGYGLEIANIAFQGNQAIISWRVVLPDPAAFYPQVITEVSAVTYIPAGYEAVPGGMLPPEANFQPADDGSASETLKSPAIIPESAPAEKKAS
jgi:hypothetical protein